MVKISTEKAEQIANIFRQCITLNVRCNLSGVKTDGGISDCDVRLRGNWTIDLYNDFGRVATFNSVADFCKFYEVE